MDEPSHEFTLYHLFCLKNHVGLYRIKNEGSQTFIIIDSLPYTYHLQVPSVLNNNNFVD